MRGEVLTVMNAGDAEKFTATASSAQTPLIVFLAEKLTAPLCFLFPKKPIGLFGVPESVTLPEAAK